MKRSLLLALTLVVATSNSVNAQERTWLVPGDRVRVSSNSGQGGDFSFVEIRSDALVVESDEGGAFVFPNGSVQGLKVNVGPRSPGCGALRGGVKGGF